MSLIKHITLFSATAALALIPHLSHAEVLPEAAVEIRIPLAKKPTSRPMTIAYVPYLKQYFIADGGLAAIPGDPMGTASQSEIHVYDDSGKYRASAKPGLDNRSIYYNDNSRQLESVTYNISSEAGFGPNIGIFSLILNEDGSLKNDANEITGHNPAFGNANTIPSYDAERNRYYAKQERSNVIRIIESPKREALGEIRLDLAAAGARFDEIAHYFIAYTGVSGEEFALLDIDHKSVLVFNLEGKFIAKSALPSSLKLRSQNHINGTGYSNGLFFVYHETDGEFGTYYGFKVLK
ncbi:hypothetical protein MTYP_00140 [Methylophilaceae bacterium]|nr:hypothetical protein MTYP_00140 [Methylophilaceae bacterium]